MTQNTIEEIKQTEVKGEEIIKKARQKVENMVLQMNQQGQNSLNNAESQASSQIDEIIENAKKEIQKIKTQNDHDLAKELDKLNKIDNKTVEKASDLIVKKILNF